MVLKTLNKYKAVVIYGCSLAALLFLLKWIEYRFLLIDYAFEIYISLIAIVFTVLGIWLALKLVKPKTQTKVETVVVEKPVYITSLHEFVINDELRTKLGLSDRELEVLQLMAEGLSNQEIADRLYVSLNTIKTHSSNIFLKLEVKRRTQAVEKAKKLQLIA